MNVDQQKEIQAKLLCYSSLKAIQILSAMAFRKKECGINDIGQLTSLPASTIHRVLQELVECGLVVKIRTKYRVGTMAKVLFQLFDDDDYVLDAASLEMTRLNDLTCETVHLIALENTDAVYIAKREAKNQIGLRSVVGKHIPLYCTSGGKLLLAFQNEKWIDLYLETVPRAKLTDHTIIDKDELLKELEKVRKQGYAVDRSEHNPEVVCVAAPIFYPSGQIACTIGVATPKYRITEEKLEQFLQEVLVSARRITEKLAQ
ncbi:MAG: IclR family transcriptional regulator [Sphaerochaetaceae bacterium]|nr:IclR family transcriptional regulator [Spirochaetales bacterium]MDY5500504.1 IclR family transcriptional regulator [Sphaerochaetaceae bacterium]